MESSHTWLDRDQGQIHNCALTEQHSSHLSPSFCFLPKPPHDLGEVIQPTSVWFQKAVYTILVWICQAAWVGVLALLFTSCMFLGKVLNHSILVSSPWNADNGSCIMRTELLNVNYLEQCLDALSTRETLTIISSSAKKITCTWPIP